MSMLREMWRRHAEEVAALRERCPHPKRMITIRHDRSTVGMGTCYGTVVVTCMDCGTQRLIHDLDATQRKKVRKQLTRQGFKGERVYEHVNCYAHHEWELERP